MFGPRFQDINAPFDPAFGGKSGGLSRLCAAGLRVPAGFSVSATTTSPDGWSSLAEFRQRCAALLVDGPISVRSSALVEDAPDRSFAGLFETVLDIRALEDAQEAAGRCIRSGASRRVLSYASQDSALPVGLVVQRFIEPAAAGVVFSREPAGRDPGMLVEAVPGVGEGLVSGRLTPENWRLYPGPFPEHHRQGPEVISSELAWEIGRTARRVAEGWGQGLDLEWAWDKAGVLWWLQARPITTGLPWVPPVVRHSAEGLTSGADGPVSVWSNFNIRESLPDPVHPLSWSLWKTTLVPSVTRAMTGLEEGTPAFERASGIDLVDGRLYFNLNALWASLGPLFFHALKHMDARVAATARELAGSRDTPASSEQGREAGTSEKRPAAPLLAWTAPPRARRPGPRPWSAAPPRYALAPRSPASTRPLCSKKSGFLQRLRRR